MWGIPMYFFPSHVHSLPQVCFVSEEEGLVRMGAEGRTVEESRSQVQRPVAWVRAELMSTCPKAQQQRGDQRSKDEKSWYLERGLTRHQE